MHIFHRTVHPEYRARLQWGLPVDGTDYYGKRGPSNADNKGATLFEDSSTKSVRSLKAAIENAVRHKSYTDLPVLRRWASQEMESMLPPNLGSSARTALVASAVSNNQHAASLLREAFKLVEQAETWVMKAEKKRSIYSPIRALPPELLGRIFVDVSHDGYFFDLVSPFPNPLLNVCRRWRSIALETPCLWAQIQLNMGRVYGIKNGGLDRLESLNACLSCAKSTPLDISFRMSTDNQRGLSDELAERAIAAMLHPGRVFGSLDYFGHLENLSALLTSPAGHSLQHLTITLQIRGSSPEDTLPVVNLLKLQSLYLYGLNQWDFIHSIQAPALSTLTVETIDMPLQELCRMSFQFPQITALCIHGVTFGAVTNSFDPQFTRLLKCDWLTYQRPTYDMWLLKSASQLTLLTLNYDGLVSFKRSITLPALQTLRLLGRDDGSHVPRSSDDGIVEMNSFLTRCPNVTEIQLLLAHPILGDELLRNLSLTPDWDRRPKCMKLKHLVLDGSPVSIPLLSQVMIERNDGPNITLGQKPKFYDTWAGCCLLSIRNFLVSPNHIALPDMDRATLMEMEAAINLLPPEALEYIHCDGSSSEDESEELCAGCDMPFVECECVDH